MIGAGQFQKVFLTLPALLLAFLGAAPPAWGQSRPAGKRLALLVGVKEYDHSKFPDLKFTENDVEALSVVLTGRSARFSGVTLLTTRRGKDSPAARPTAANIRKAIAALLKRRTKHDLVLVALAGHGVELRVKGAGGRETDEAFFCPADARLTDRSSLISLKKLVADLDESGAGVKLLLVDACRNDPAAGRSLDPDTVPRPPRGLSALFSCATGQRSFETDKLGKGHGVFFHFVLEGLRGKARNEDNEVTWEDLTAFVKRKVSRSVPTLIGSGAQQSPHLISNIVNTPVLVRLRPNDPSALLKLEGRLASLLPDGTQAALYVNLKPWLRSKLYRKHWHSDINAQLRTALDPKVVRQMKEALGLDLEDIDRVIIAAETLPDLRKGRFLVICPGKFSFLPGALDRLAEEGRKSPDITLHELPVGIGSFRTCYEARIGVAFLLSPTVLLLASDRGWLEEFCRKLAGVKTTQVSDPQVRTLLGRVNATHAAGLVIGPRTLKELKVEMESFIALARVSDKAVGVGAAIVCKDPATARKAFQTMRKGLGEMASARNTPASLKEAIGDFLKRARLKGAQLALGVRIKDAAIGDLMRLAKEKK
jgi:hypothetical protein